MTVLCTWCCRFSPLWYYWSWNYSVWRTRCTVDMPLQYSPAWKKLNLIELIVFWSNRHGDAEKSDPIAEWIIPKAVELQALPTGQCFIVSCICHSTVHTFVMTVQQPAQPSFRLWIGWHITLTIIASNKRLRKLDIFVFTSPKSRWTNEPITRLYIL